MHEPGEVARGVQLLVGPGGLEVGGEALQVSGCRFSLGEGVHDRFRGDHSAFHGGMVALDLDAVECARVTAHQQAAGEVHARQGIKPTLGDSPSAIGQARATLEVLLRLRVVFPALEFLVGAHMGIAIVQVGNEADVNLVVFGVVEESAARGVAFCQGPAEAVNHEAFRVLLGGNLPDLLDTDTVVLGIRILVQLELAHELLAQVAAAAFCKYGVLRVQLHARHVAVLLLTVRADAHITGSDTLHAAIFVVQDLRGGKTRVNLDTQAFGLLGQPATDIAHRHDVIAVVVSRLRDEKVG